MSLSQDVLVSTELQLFYQAQHVLRGVSTRIARGETVAITGPSGSGKTTLLYCLSGLEFPQQGRVELLGRDVAGMARDELSDLRLRHIGFVFQSADLVPELTLSQNIALPLELAGCVRRVVRERVAELVDVLGLTECEDRRPAQVSGGQAQRAAVGRALSARPALIFADEPTGALDSANRDVVLDLLLTQVRELGASLVTVTHDEKVAERFGRRVQLADGLILSDSGALAVT